MEKATAGLQKMLVEFELVNEGMTIPTPVQWLANRRAFKEGRQNGEIAASWVVCVVRGSKVSKGFVKKGYKAAGVWY